MLQKATNDGKTKKFLTIYEKHWNGSIKTMIFRKYNIYSLDLIWTKMSPPMNWTS